MKEIRISDISMQKLNEGNARESMLLSFREKLELAKLLDRLGVSVIEIEGICADLSSPGARIDQLRIKSIASAVKNSVIAVPVRFSEDLDLMKQGIMTVWDTLKEAVCPRLQVRVPVSSVQMEYLTDMKTKAILPTVAEALRFCRELTGEVELVAEDATRGDGQVLHQIIQMAAEKQVALLTLCDAAGAMLPNEFQVFIMGLKAEVPAFSNLSLGVSFSNALAMADACAMVAVSCGAEEIKGTAYPSPDINVVSIENMARVLEVKAGAFSATTKIHITQLKQLTSRISRIFEGETGGQTKVAAISANDDDSQMLTVRDNQESIARVIDNLGYDLSQEEISKVYGAFLKAVEKKEKISCRELDAIVASTALQVPSTYEIEHYAINTGDAMTATSHMRIIKKKLDEKGCVIGEPVIRESVCMGDGPIDASFQAIEQIVGTHYELDDFQIQSVTRGREAMGEAVVKLRGEGKIYSGRGISTDIIRSSIDAYISALNKIVYENTDRA